MKRIIALTVCLCIFTAALSGCGSSSPEDGLKESSVQTASVTEEETKTEEPESWLPAELPEASEVTAEAEPTAEPAAEIVVPSNIEAEAETESQEEPPEIPEKPEEETPAEEGNEITGGATLEEAQRILPNTRYLLKPTGEKLWFVFTTGEQAGTEYIITLENLTQDSDRVYAWMYDADGNALKPTERNNDYYSFGVDTPFCLVNPNGTANSGMINTLEPNTEYYIRISGSQADLLLTVTDPSGEAESTAGVVNIIMDPEAVEPGSSQSAALYIPLQTTVFGTSTGNYSYFAFTTTEKENEAYYITVVNCTVGSDRILACMYDRFGNALHPTERNNDYDMLYTDTPICVAYEDGTANTGMIDTLEPQTTYYIRVSADEQTDFSFRVSTIDEESDRYHTSSVFEMAKNPLEETDEYYAGTNQTVATMLKTNTSYYGTVTDGTDWVAFTTDETESLSYTLTAQKLSESTNNIFVCLIDEYGNALVPAERQNSYYAYAMDTPFCYPGGDGAENSGVSSPLEPNTTYYIRIDGDSGTDYMIMIGKPDTMEETEETAETVFNIPFELNETQVRFVGDEANFIDENEARAALAPVAEIILAHPGHPILIAGTTATVGKQEECLELSQQRADAVKNMLVQEFGVPADQLITIGLGYAADPFVRGWDVDANGNQVETEAAKNRRVVVLDADSELGQQILGN